MLDLYLSRLSSECPQYARRQSNRFSFLVAPFVYREAREKLDFSSFDHRGRVEVEYSLFYSMFSYDDLPYLRLAQVSTVDRGDSCVQTNIGEHTYCSESRQTRRRGF